MMWTENKSVIYTTAREDDVSAKGGTAQDRKDMWRVGRQQELNRNFRFLSVLGFTAVLMCTWEAVLLCVSPLPDSETWDRQHTYRNSGASYGLINGGKGGMIYTYLGGLVGFSFVILSMAEMASMAPTSGGQYHWVSEFAPPSCQCILSYITGWVCVLGWHTGIAGCCYTVANMMVGVVAINYPDSYMYEPWHVTLLVIAVALVALLFNTLLAQKLPLIEGMILIIHCFGFFGILIPLWVLSPRPAASEVFGSIEDRGGWGNNGLACLVGLVGPIYALIVQLKGPDSAVHMSEEIRDASRVLPLGMIWTLILNGSTGLVMIVTLAFCVGDIDHVLESQTGFAFIQVFLNSTGSVRAATGMTVVIMVMQFCAAISNVATTSRQIYAFARDKGLPFSNFLSKVNPTFTVPLNALCVSLAIVSLLSLINIGSSVAFNAIMSLGTAALLSSYIISITCVRIRRWRKQPLPPARWSMGRFTPFVDTVSILVLTVIWVFSFFPLTAHVNSTNMNWGVVIFGGVILLCLVYYQLRAKKVYKGPVTRVSVMPE
ncbi:putative amino acid permease [Aspergillus udagawae]|nr:putative amino acid permease [Aspergillus udagawae]